MIIWDTVRVALVIAQNHTLIHKIHYLWTKCRHLLKNLFNLNHKTHVSQTDSKDSQGYSQDK